MTTEAERLARLRADVDDYTNDDIDLSVPVGDLRAAIGEIDKLALERGEAWEVLRKARTWLLPYLEHEAGGLSEQQAARRLAEQIDGILAR